MASEISVGGGGLPAHRREGSALLVTPTPEFLREQLALKYGAEILNVLPVPFATATM
jgi:hypothetical protein